MLRGLVVSPEDVYCYCYCVIVLLLLLLRSIFFILLRGLVVSPEDGLAAPFVAVVVAIALSVAPAINKFLSIKPFNNNNKIIKHIFHHTFQNIPPPSFARIYLSSMGMQVPSLQAEVEKDAFFASTKVLGNA